MTNMLPKINFKEGMKKIIEVVPYDTNWVDIYQKEAALIQEALGDNCLAIHHIGSTSVPELAAKPIIDILIVAKNTISAQKKLESIGVRYKGEYNIPLHYGFDKKDVDKDLHIHLYEDGHPEIDLNLTFRDYLRDNPKIRNEYAELKKKLINDPSTHEVNQTAFTRSNYTLRKGDFIREVLKEAGFNKTRMLKCNDNTEWTAAKCFRDAYFFGHHGIEDPYT